MRMVSLLRTKIMQLAGIGAGIVVTASMGVMSVGTATAQGVPQSRHATAHTYAALGDSVAAGYGLPAGSDTTAADVQCGRSSDGYPHLVASALDMPLTNATCAGATAGDLVTRQFRGGTLVAPAQLDTAFAAGTPELITITAGANDLHWTDFIKACYTTDCTASAYTNAANTARFIMKIKLNAALADIYLRSGGTPPQVVVTGYYNPFSAACASQQSAITPAEIAWFSSQVQALNRALRQTANNYFYTTYVPVDFSGHDICSSDSWIQGPTAAQPFHPTATGQAMIAKDVLDIAAADAE